MIYQLYFYVPESHLAEVKDAIFAVGAGRIGNYDKCCWQVMGTGQFRPLAGSNPYLGEAGKVEEVVEYKVETVCEEKYLQSVLDALKKTHPYETPAYGVIKITL